jgi:ADP-ribose pyrophosphatase
MPEILHRGRYLTLLNDGGWEYVTRTNATGVVVVVAITPDAELLLVEQHRPALGGKTLELPAGLAGDHAGSEEEPLVEAAKRELVEETGFQASLWQDLGASPVSAGLTDETVHFFFAGGLEKVGPGGGDDSEDIVVLRVPLDDVRDFLEAKRRKGVHIDAKIGAGLWLATAVVQPTR